MIGIFQRQKESGEPLTIVGDGSQRRDFIHVKDVARANFLAAMLPLKGHEGEVFNVGSGKAYSIQEIADAISDNQVYIDKRSGEMQTTFAPRFNDSSKAINVSSVFPEKEDATTKVFFPT